jgi:hypothetical protein
MATHTHIHLHLAPGMFGGMSTADGFEESKHARTGGKFSSGSGGAKPATGAAAFAAKHNPAAARKGSGPQTEAEVSEQKASLL